MDFVTVSTGLILPYWMGLPIRYIQYYENGGIPERKKFKRVSKWDPLFDVIISLADVPGSYLMSIFQVLNYEYNGNLPGNYNSFKEYAYRRGIKCTPADQTPHVYYETEPGEQLQCDWL